MWRTSVSVQLFKSIMFWIICEFSYAAIIFVSTGPTDPPIHFDLRIAAIFPNRKLISFGVFFGNVFSTKGMKNKTTHYAFKHFPDLFWIVFLIRITEND